MHFVNKIRHDRILQFFGWNNICIGLYRILLVFNSAAAAFEHLRNAVKFAVDFIAILMGKGISTIEANESSNNIVSNLVGG